MTKDPVPPSLEVTREAFSRAWARMVKTATAALDKKLDDEFAPLVLGWSVSYRNRWWHRRLYACGNVTRKEAEDLALLMRRTGYRRIRLERA